MQIIFLLVFEKILHTLHLSTISHAYTIQTPKVYTQIQYTHSQLK